MLGIWTDQFGWRIVFPLTMLASAASTFLLSYADNYYLMLLAALGLGLAGGGFAVGVAYVSKFYPLEKQGSALGFFGMGNVGAAVTKFLAPRSEAHTSELQSLMRISYAVFCLKKKNIYPTLVRSNKHKYAI